MGLVFKLLKEFQEKPDVVFMCISVISLCVKCGPLVLELVKLGGILLLNDIVKHHPKDSYIQAVVPDLIKQLRVAGTQQAVHEIHMESMTLEFCTHCQEVAQRAKDKEEGVDIRARLSEPNNFKGAIVPSGCNRINKATYFMKEYADVDTVQIAGLDAIIIFARSGDAKEAIDDTTAIETAVVALDNFPANESIVWRVALLLSTLARLKVTYAMEIVTDNVHHTLARDFQRYRVAPYVQQQILWLFGNLLIWPRVRLEIQRTESCMVLFNAFDYRPKPTIEMEHMSKIELEMLKVRGERSVLHSHQLHHLHPLPLLTARHPSSLAHSPSAERWQSQRAVPSRAAAEAAGIHACDGREAPRRRGRKGEMRRLTASQSTCDVAFHAPDRPCPDATSFLFSLLSLSRSSRKTSGRKTSPKNVPSWRRSLASALWVQSTSYPANKGSSTETLQNGRKGTFCRPSTRPRRCSETPSRANPSPTLRRSPTGPPCRCRRGRREGHLRVGCKKAAID